MADQPTAPVPAEDKTMPSLEDLQRADAMRRVYMARYRKDAAVKAKAAFDAADVSALISTLNGLKETHSDEAVAQAIGVWVQIITEAQKAIERMIDQAQKEGWPTPPEQAAQ